MEIAKIAQTNHNSVESDETETDMLLMHHSFTSTYPLGFPFL